MHGPKSRKGWPVYEYIQRRSSLDEAAALASGNKMLVLRGYCTAVHTRFSSAARAPWVVVVRVWYEYSTVEAGGQFVYQAITHL